MVQGVNDRWIFLRGLGRETGHWNSFPDLFAKTIGVSPVLLDLPGVGSACHEGSPVSMTSIVETLKGQLEPPYSLLGISFGGMLAFHWAYLYPKQVKRLVVINSSAANLNPPFQRLLPLAAKELAKIVMQRDEVARELKVLELVTNKLEAKEVVAKKFAELARFHPVSKRVLIQQLFTASIFRIHKILTPCLLLVSEQDRLCSFRCSEKLSQFLGAPIDRHETAGHDLPLEDPAWVCDRVKAWLEKN